MQNPIALTGSQPESLLLEWVNRADEQEQEQEQGVSQQYMNLFVFNYVDRNYILDIHYLDTNKALSLSGVILDHLVDISLTDGSVKRVSKPFFLDLLHIYHS